MQNTGGDLAPLGLTQLAAYLRQYQYSVGIIDAVVDRYEIDELVDKIIELKPRIIGLTAITPIFHRAKLLAKKIKEKDPSVFIILGGHHATVLPEDVIKSNKCFDMLVCSEGELTIKEILDKLKKSEWNKKLLLNNYKELSKTQGIAFRDNNSAVITPKRELITDLDILPLPAWDLLPMEKYLPLPNQYKRKPVANLVAIRGCPFGCSFCSNNSIFGRRARALSPVKLLEWIEYLIKHYGVREISFWDDMMTINKDWMNKFCDVLINSNTDITWTCYARVDTVDLDVLKHIRKAGCCNIFFGFESGNQELLNNINKGTTLDQIRAANSWCKEVGIEVRASFMVGLPGETPEMAEKTISFVKELSPDYVQFCITTPFPGTQLFYEAEKYGLLTKDYSEYNIWKAVFVPYGYKDAKQIENISKRAMRQFYLRPKYVIGRILKVDSKEDLVRYFKGLKLLLGFIKK